MFENPRTGRQARNFTTNEPKILDLKSSTEQMFSENLRWVPLMFSLAWHFTITVDNRETDNGSIRVESEKKKKKHTGRR